MNRIMSHPENRPVVRKLLFSSLLLIILPVGAFFWLSSGGVAAAILGKDSPYILAASAGASVFLINIVLVGYVVMAFSESDPRADVPGRTKKD